MGVEAGRECKAASHPIVQLRKLVKTHLKGIDWIVLLEASPENEGSSA